MTNAEHNAERTRREWTIGLYTVSSLVPFRFQTPAEGISIRP